jgi:hypothetical protein
MSIRASKRSRVEEDDFISHQFCACIYSVPFAREDLVTPVSLDWLARVPRRKTKLGIATVTTVANVTAL